MQVALHSDEEVVMRTKIFSWAALAGATVAGVPGAARAETPVVIIHRPLAEADKPVLPNPLLLQTGFVTLAAGYGAAVIAGEASEHKGDNKLFIPVAGPWLDLGN